MIVNKLTRRNRKSVQPADFRYYGEHTEEKTEIQYFLFNKSFIEENQDFQAVDDILNLRKENSTLWLNVHSLRDSDIISKICRQLGMHRLFIHDILDTSTVSRIQDLGDYILFTVKSYNYTADEGLDVEQITFILGNSFIYSFQEKRADHFEHIRIRLREDIGLTREKGADYLLFLLLEAIIDNYESTIENIEDKLEKLTKLDAEANVTTETMIKIANLKNELNTIKKNILPIVDALTKLESNYSTIIDEQNDIYFTNLKNNCLHLSDLIVFYIQKLEGAINIYFTIQDQKLNQIIKILTIVSTIFIPLTFIAGIYGMNFENMPELKWHNGYFFALGMMSILVLVMIGFFKKKKWF